MRKRTLARECALKILYQKDITDRPIEIVLESFWPEQEEEFKDPEVQEFANRLASGVVQNIEEIVCGP